jgi:hypothetical protein
MDLVVILRRLTMMVAELIAVEMGFGVSGINCLW